MKDYKRKFITSNLIMVGVLLIIMNAMIFIYAYNAGEAELKTTMEQKIEPYGALMNILREKPLKQQDINDNKDNNTALQKNDEKRRPPVLTAFDEQEDNKYAKNVYVFFYDEYEHRVSVISENTLENKEELTELAEKIKSQKEDFGTIASDDLYYYRQPGGREIKIAVASRDFLRIENIKLLSALALIFVFVMIGVYYISLKLADRAVSPLSESIAREKQFITDASHDLKTPLTVILSGADILAANEEKTVGEMEKWVSSIKSSADNMKALIEEMLALSKSEMKNEEKSEADISDIVEKCALMMESAAYEKGVEYTYDIEKGVIVFAGKEDVRRVVSELIGNALKYEERGGAIAISLRSDRKKAYFTVTNKKTLIDSADIEHIFERFYRSDKSRSGGAGHGLGLAIAKNLVRASGGEIAAVSKNATGTIFSVSLPIKN